MIPAPKPTCWREDSVGRSRNSNRTPNNIPKPIVEIKEPNTKRTNNDLPFGVDTLSLIASIGLTWEAFLAGNKEESIVTVIPIANPINAACEVKTNGPSGNPNSKYCRPSLTAIAKPIPNPIPKPEPITDIKSDSEITSR